MLAMMAELDVDLLSKFRCLGTTDRDVLIDELHGLLSGQVSRGDCTFILEMSNWNLQNAVGAYYDYFCSTPAILSSTAGAPTTSSLEMQCLSDPSSSSPPPPEVVTVGAGFSRSWKITNSGFHQWPLGVELILFSGYRLEAPDTILVPSIGPGEMIEVAIPFQAPNSPGLYEGHWRLCTSDKKPFGDLLIVSVRVVREEEEEDVMVLTQQLSEMQASDADAGVSACLLSPLTHTSALVQATDLEHLPLDSDTLDHTNIMSHSPS